MVPVTPTTHPWAYAKNYDPQLLIACVEELGDIYYTEYLAQTYSGYAGTHTVQANTDNKGNTYIINKHYTSKFPGCCLTMELVDRTTQSDLYLRVEHKDRSQNIWADQLADLNDTGFNPARRWIPTQPLTMFETTYALAKEMGLHLTTETKHNEYLLQQHETRKDERGARHDTRPQTKWIKRGHNLDTRRVVFLDNGRHKHTGKTYDRNT